MKRYIYWGLLDRSYLFFFFLITIFLFLKKLKLFKTNICVNFWTLLGLKSQLTQTYDHTGVLLLNGHKFGPEEEVTPTLKERSKGDGP